ncbi:MAG: LPS export ABC transporter periplasmic protein LptC [Bacteroidetes bacterium]|nr:MAG: LPS export ABC transporter periplasmic protein LptC [Bacteroidota bacterium]
MMAGIFFSCVNDLDSIKKISASANDPDERTRELRVLYSDSGKVQVEVYARLAETYSHPKPIVKLKDSIEVRFYNPNGNLVSVLTALYGEIDQQNGQMFVRDSVHLYNPIKKQRLETEELKWNQKDSTIFTNKDVAVRTEDAIFYGKGLKTRQDFSHYEFLKPLGKLKLK